MFVFFTSLVRFHVLSCLIIVYGFSRIAEAQMVDMSGHSAYVRISTAFSGPSLFPKADSLSSERTFIPKPVGFSESSVSGHPNGFRYLHADRIGSEKNTFLRRCSECSRGIGDVSLRASGPQARRPSVLELSQTPPASRGNRLWSSLKRETGRVCADYRHFYSRDTMLNFGLGIGMHAIVSNTSIDQEFRNWVQDDVRSAGTDNAAIFFKTFGEGLYFIPLFAVSDVVYRYCQETGMLREGSSRLGDFASRTTRAYLVGTPTLLVGQSLIGCSRPGETDHESRWSPFSDNNSISGHAFIGATPFLAAASVSKPWWLKASFYTLSFMPALSRINDDAHYLSQCALGWYLSYLSVRAVSKTDGECLPRGLTVFPITETDAFGIGFVFRR
ncbi:MAG TPA: hypothetical protein DEB39_05640 [Planctomycetaceae bacterium]|nr:hypothetical protein [Planctomycetaceae bacterium]